MLGPMSEHGRPESVWLFLSVSMQWERGLEPAKIRSSVEEEHCTKSKSWQKNEDAEQEGRGSCRLSLETNGLPMVTVCLSCTSSFM